MLVIQRRPGEEFVIGEDIKVVVLEVKSGMAVRIGIEAPREVPIMRSEVLRRIQDEIESESSEPIVT